MPSPFGASAGPLRSGGRPCACATALLRLLFAPSTAPFAHACPRRQDPRNIIDSADLKLVLGSVDKHPANPILTEDKAWELRFDNFQPSVWVDPVDQKWKLWCAFRLLVHRLRFQRLSLPPLPQVQHVLDLQPDVRARLPGRLRRRWHAPEEADAGAPGSLQRH